MSSSYYTTILKKSHKPLLIINLIYKILWMLYIIIVFVSVLKCIIICKVCLLPGKFIIVNNPVYYKNLIQFVKGNFPSTLFAHRYSLLIICVFTVRAKKNIEGKYRWESKHLQNDFYFHILLDNNNLCYLQEY